MKKTVVAAAIVLCAIALCIVVGPWRSSSELLRLNNIVSVLESSGMYVITAQDPSGKEETYAMWDGSDVYKDVHAKISTDVPPGGPMWANYRNVTYDEGENLVYVATELHVRSEEDVQRMDTIASSP